MITRLNEGVVQALKLQDVRERLSGLGVEPISSTPLELANIIKAEMTDYAKLSKSANIKVD
ncbi:MAG: hypothetical protein H7125_17465 [Proteobacteria bacterium]|nr:hypothetical protein [Burkholderiales bacterium]